MIGYGWQDNLIPQDYGVGLALKAQDFGLAN